ncbi:MAG: hypothetical protein Q4B28_07715 [bacterium]|nr:hypothetical protein [bacterium]
MYAGNKLSELLDQHDLDEMQQVLSQENAQEMIETLGETLSTRIEKTEI